MMRVQMFIIHLLKEVVPGDGGGLQVRVQENIPPRPVQLNVHRSSAKQGAHPRPKTSYGNRAAGDCEEDSFRAVGKCHARNGGAGAHLKKYLSSAVVLRVLGPGEAVPWFEFVVR